MGGHPCQLEELERHLRVDPGRLDLDAPLPGTRREPPTQLLEKGIHSYSLTPVSPST